jgi:ribosomal protein S18 acetylase RimI-like enzyme
MREIIKEDLKDLKEIIDSNELFPSDLLDEMTETFFNESKKSEIWLTQEINQKPIGVAYCAPEKMTEGTYNLYLIAIHKNFQGQGFGSKIMADIENKLKNQGARILIVETSGLPSFELTRKFYDKLGYHREAKIREFYQKGEDKIIFWKKLN